MNSATLVTSMVSSDGCTRSIFGFLAVSSIFWGLPMAWWIEAASSTETPLAVGISSGRNA